MEDREIVAAIVAGDLSALADAYDGYAESLYGYCRWMLTEPDDAADAIQDTFAIAAGRLGLLRDPRKLRPWLYAVARNECHRRRRVSEMGPAETTDLGPKAGDSSDNIERAELRRIVRAALSGLSSGEREVLELSLRHDLQGADLAAVLGISREQAHTLAARARDQLDQALGPALVALTGRRACGHLDGLLAGWDGQLTAHTRKEIRRHFDECEACDNRRRGALRPATLFGMVPLTALPLWLRREVLGLCSDGSDETLKYRHDVMLRAEPFLPSGFPQAIREPRRRLVAATRIAAAAGVVIALASAGIISALALGSSHSPHSLTAARASASPTVSAVQTTGPAASAVAPPSTSATASPTEVVEQQAPATPSASATTTKPAPSHSASSSAPPRPRPSLRPSTPAPTPTPTPTLTPTPTPTPIPTLTVSAAPTVSSSTTPP